MAKCKKKLTAVHLAILGRASAAPLSLSLEDPEVSWLQEQGYLKYYAILREKKEYWCTESLRLVSGEPLPLDGFSLTSKGSSLVYGFLEILNA